MTHSESSDTALLTDDLFDSSDNTTIPTSDSSNSQDHHAGTYDQEFETTFEIWSDIILGVAFGITMVLSGYKMYWSRRQAFLQQQMSSQQQNGGQQQQNVVAETTVVTAFYSLIFLTSTFRSIWFLIPNFVWKPSYVPMAVLAFDSGHPSWVGVYLSILVVSAGSLALFSIFILILVYWADILKKYFYPGQRRSRPMFTFITLVSILIGYEVLNSFLFFLRVYSSEGMILLNTVMLSIVSIICVMEISIFSHRFRTVLKTLGAINQVSTEGQVKRIVWITVTGNLFFFTRAFLETIFAIMLLVYWHQYGTLDKVFKHSTYDTYVLLKYWSEVAILSLMLYILQSRFATQQQAQQVGGSEVGTGGGYQSIPNTDPGLAKQQQYAMNI